MSPSKKSKTMDISSVWSFLSLGTRIAVAVNRTASSVIDFTQCLRVCCVTGTLCFPAFSFVGYSLRALSSSCEHVEQNLNCLAVRTRLQIHASPESSRNSDLISNVSSLVDKVNKKNLASGKRYIAPPIHTQ